MWAWKQTQWCSKTCHGKECEIMLLWAAGEERNSARLQAPRGAGGCRWVPAPCPLGTQCDRPVQLVWDPFVPVGSGKYTRANFLTVWRARRAMKPIDISVEIPSQARSVLPSRRDFPYGQLLVMAELAQLSHETSCLKLDFAVATVLVWASSQCLWEGRVWGDLG